MVNKEEEDDDQGVTSIASESESGFDPPESSPPASKLNIHAPTFIPFADSIAARRLEILSEIAAVANHQPLVPIVYGHRPAHPHIHG